MKRKKERWIERETSKERERQNAVGGHRKKRRTERQKKDDEVRGGANA